MSVCVRTIVMLALVLLAPRALAQPVPTWFVYCEGREGDRNIAILSENRWDHPGTDGYAARIAAKAESFVERRTATTVYGCAAIPFSDPALADHSFARTVRLHRHNGDIVRTIIFPESARR